MNKRSSGLFITLEGIDLTGKTSVLTYIKKNRLLDNARFVSEFSHYETGKYIKKILKESILLRLNYKQKSSFTETFILLADSYLRYYTEILSLLHNGDIVIKERFIDSHVAYQIPLIRSEFPELNRTELIAWFASIVRIKRQILPDLTIIFDINTDTVFKRYDNIYNKCLTEFEKQILREVKQLYLNMPKIYLNVMNPSRIHIIRVGGKTVPDIAERVVNMITNKLTKHED